MRFGDKGRSLLDASLSISHSRWRNIQADVIDSSGFPTTANIGNGRITSLSGAIATRPTAARTYALGTVYNHRSVVAPLTHVLTACASATARHGRNTTVSIRAVLGSDRKIIGLGRRGLMSEELRGRA